MSGVIRYKAIDSEQYAKLVIAWLDAASPLVNTTSKLAVYHQFRNTILNVIEGRAEEVVEYTRNDVHFHLILAKSQREKLRQRWNKLKKTIPHHTAVLESFKALDAAVSSLRVTPDDSGKIERLLNE